MADMTRRGVLASLTVAALPFAARAAVTPDRLFGGTPYADNRVARTFARVDLPLPDVAVLTAAGERRLPQLAGKARLLTLWAEWCVPCLIEARDLAALQPRFARDRFDIVSVLTGSSGRLDYAGATERLRRAGATGLTLLAEPDGRHAIADALSTRPPAGLLPPIPTNLPPGAQVVNAGGGGFALPCTLLVDRHGRVRGRATGMQSASVRLPAGAVPGRPLSEADKQALLDGPTKTGWTTPDGIALLRALSEGLLDRV